MEKTLLKLKQSNRLCEVYANANDPSYFVVGYVRACIEDYTILEMFDPYGHYDGIGCFFTDEIFNVATGSEYLNAIAKLIANYTEQSQYKLESISNLDDLYSIIQSDRRICEIELCDSRRADVIGFIESIDEDKIKISVVEQYGKLKGTSLVRKEMISVISFDSCDTNKLEILQKANNS